MKKFLAIAVLGLASLSSFAEASFDQIEGLIQQKNYAAAASGLEVIVQNHPHSAKAFYAMAQAQAGLGNLEKANKALTIATGLNPTLDFAPEGSVQKLKQAITPQVAKIESIEESHTTRNVMIFLVLVVSGFAIWFAYGQAKSQREEAEREAEEEKARAERREALEEYNRKAREREAAERAEAEAKEAALKAHKNYGHERFDPSNPDKLKSVKQFKEEKLAEAMVAQARAEAAEAKSRAEAAEATARMYRTSAQAVQPTHTTVVNNSGNDMLTGILVGNMLSGSHHDTTRVVEREVIREVPSSSRSSSWDDTPSTPSRSSSWDDSSSSSSSSSWGSSSSSSSSSSWDSGSSSSSSSDSGSSSSWD
jgi:type II secretory pathway pseudopilin PulG